MKKIFVFTLALCILCIALCACNSTTSQTNNQPSESNNNFDNVLPLELETPPAHNSYSLDSYQSLTQALTQASSKEYLEIRQEQTDCGAVYQKTLSEFADGTIKLAIPSIDGKEVPLRNREGYSNITLMTSELYNLPWIWYHCTVDNQDLTVSISYPSVLDNSDINSAASYYEVLKIIAPKAPTPENYTEFDSYKNIYEKEITLKDGSIVKAMISDVKDSPRDYVHFYKDGLMVILNADSELFNDEFWKKFEIIKYTYTE